MIEYRSPREQKAIAIDIETYDPNLIEMGTGVYRNDGYILGVSVAFPDGFSEYYNLGHPDCTKDEREKSIEYIKEVCSTPVPKVGTRLTYDIDWLANWLHIPVNGSLYDIQVAEALIDENQGQYSLDFLSMKYLKIHKQNDELQEYCDVRGWKGDVRKHLYKMDYNTVRKYARGDVVQPLEIFKQQWAIMHAQDLLTVFELETKMLRVVLRMKRTGARIDTAKRDVYIEDVTRHMLSSTNEITSKYGGFNFNSTPQIAKVFDKLHIPYAHTANGNPSITKDTLKALEDDHEIAKLLLDVRKGTKILGTFLDGSLKRFVTPDDLIHCDFYATRTDDYGTRSGRLSAANPNLQQIPAKGRDAYYGEVCRSIFIPFDDHLIFKIDYSQIEYRVIAHYATGPGSDELRQSYILNPFIDYHQYIVDLTGLTRSYAKNLNFGIGYGMGVNKMHTFFGWPLEKCYEILFIYNSRAPYVKATMYQVSEIAKRREYIKTILGRRARLVDKKKAYIMFNRLIQGSAADIMKKAMVDSDDAGIFDVMPLHLTVHDELVTSMPRTKEGVEAAIELKHIMETATLLKVPIIADAEIGENWFAVKPFDAAEWLGKT